MARPSLPDDSLAAQLRRLEDRLSVLERSGQLRSASVREGTFTAIDDNGNELVHMGLLRTGRYGLDVYDDTGGRRFEVGTDGFIDPRFAGITRDPGAIKTVTSGTFTQTWSVVFPHVIGPGVEVWVGWATDVTTTGEVRLNVSGTVTDTYPMPANSSGNLYFRWLHQQTLGSGPMGIIVEARRTSGAGNVSIYQTPGWLRDPADCTTGGLT